MKNETKAKNGMIIQTDNGTKDFHLCPSCKIDYSGDGQAPNDEKIPIFYSARHAHDEGWRVAKHYRFSENGRPVWICPDCWPSAT